MSLGNHPNVLSGGSTTAGGSTPGNFTTVTATSVTTGTVTATTGAFTAGGAGTGGVSYGSIAPITLYVKSVTMLTAGTPADIATITIPAGITRWTVSSANVTTRGNFSTIIAETAAGTLIAGTVVAFDGAGATGVQIMGTSPSPSAAGVKTEFLSQGGAVLSSSGTIYIRQTGNSANAGTCSFYITVAPVP